MKKYLALLCAAALSVSVLTGCGSEPVQEEEELHMELSLWCCSDCPAAEAFAVLAESYTRVRPSTKINVTVFEAEDELLSAAEDKLPDMVLCSHTAASELSEKDQLWDCSTLFGGISPGIVPIYGGGCIGKSFFPLCYDADVLCVSAA